MSHAAAPPGVVSFPSVVRMNQVIGLTGLSRATIYRHMAAGHFPRNFKIGTVASGWLEAEVRSWISERAMSRHSGDFSDHQVAA